VTRQRYMKTFVDIEVFVVHANRRPMSMSGSSLFRDPFAEVEKPRMKTMNAHMSEKVRTGPGRATHCIWESAQGDGKGVMREKGSCVPATE
jgi:hypothetical protein